MRSRACLYLLPAIFNRLALMLVTVYPQTDICLHPYMRRNHGWQETKLWHIQRHATQGEQDAQGHAQSHAQGNAQAQVTRTARVCSTDGCPEVVLGSSYCDTHMPAPWAGSTRAQQRPIGWARIRARVLRRDGNVCQYCGSPATEVDHVVPVSRGGGHALSNLVASCHGCNADKNVRQRRQ